MESILKKYDSDPFVQDLISSKMSTLELIEKDFPGAIIVHDLADTSVVYMNSWGLKHLDTTLKKLQKIGREYHDYYFNPEDNKDYGPKILALLEQNMDDEFVSYFQQVRRSPEHDWAWYLSSTKVFVRDKKRKPVLIISTAIPVDAKHHLTNKVQRLLEENTFLRQNGHIFNSLTKREKEILKMIAMGRSSNEISKKLNISEATANTHRRNLKSKLNADNAYDLTRFAQAFDLI